MRSEKLDTLRGWAIIGMMMYHANYISRNIFLVDIFHLPDAIWLILGRIVALLFISVAGVSFFISSYEKAYRDIFSRSLRRSLLLGSIALSISFLTYTFFYEQRIVFGIIHFFAIVSVLSILFIPLGRVNILLGVLLIFLGQVITWTPESYSFIVLGFYPKGFFSSDHYPLIPWLGYYLIGYGGACYLEKKKLLPSLLAGQIFGGKMIAYFGRYSLILYVLHVPILYMIGLILISL